MLPDIVPAFEAALLDIADLLSDAHCLERRGCQEKARVIYALAEECALRSGYLELMRLVWAHSSAPARSSGF